MNFLTDFPDASALLEKGLNKNVPDVNGHVHTPYSFSSFDNIAQIFELAEKEKIHVIGINDFFVADGYEQFYGYAVKTSKFPLFNVEFIGLLPSFQQKGITVNDPNNPGRIYFSGKGLNYPFSVSENNQNFLQGLFDESQVQVKEMVEKAEQLLQDIDSNLTLTYKDVKAKYAKELVRERHIATAIRSLVDENFASEEEKVAFYTPLFGTAPKSDINSVAAIENEIRGKLLKAGGAAFVEESPEAFPAVERIQEYILNAGGIPCYPVLLDDRKGNLITGFESNWAEMDQQLKAMNVHMLELIPSRNSVEKLREFVAFFKAKGYVISLGSEHNTPGLFPLEVKVDGEKELPADLKEISYEGACVIAAHQYLKTKGEDGFVAENGKRTNQSAEYLVELGNAVIKNFIA